MEAPRTCSPPLPPIRPCHADFRGGLERVVEQSVRMQFQQPLAFLYIALGPGQILGVPCVQINFETTLFQNLVQRDPIYAGRTCMVWRIGWRRVKLRRSQCSLGNGAHYGVVRPDQNREPMRRFDCFTVGAIYGTFLSSRRGVSRSRCWPTDRRQDQPGPGVRPEKGGRYAAGSAPSVRASPGAFELRCLPRGAPPRSDYSRRALNLER